MRRFFCTATKQQNKYVEVIKKKITQYPVLVYAKSYCKHSKMAKELLGKMQVDYQKYDLDQIEGGAEMQAALLEITGQKTVPNIFVNHKHVGGNSDLQRANTEGNLTKWFDKAKVKYVL